MPKPPPGHGRQPACLTALQECALRERSLPPGNVKRDAVDLQWEAREREQERRNTERAAAWAERVRAVGIWPAPSDPGGAS